MGSLVTRWLNDLGQMKMSRLITPVVVLVIVILVIRWASTPAPPGVVMEVNDGGDHVFKVKYKRHTSAC